LLLRDEGALRARDNRPAPEFLRAIKSHPRCISAVQGTKLQGYIWNCGTDPMRPRDNWNRPCIGILVSTVSHPCARPQEENTVEKGTEYLSLSLFPMFTARIDWFGRELPEVGRLSRAGCRVGGRYDLSRPTATSRALSTARLTPSPRTDIVLLMSEHSTVIYRLTHKP